MVPKHLVIAFGLFLPASFWLAAPSFAQQAPAVQSQAAESSGVPEALAQMADGDVVATYANGKLTVKARNAGLIDVLRAVCSQIGAELDAPMDAGQPVQRTLGPAPASEVLASLLRSSEYSYVTSGTADDPNAIARLTLYPKPAESESPVVAKQLLGGLSAVKQEIANYSPPADASSNAEAPPETDILQHLQSNPALVDQIEATLKAALDAAASADPSAASAAVNPNAPAVLRRRRR